MHETAAPALPDLQLMDVACRTAPFNDAAWSFTLWPCGSQRVLAECGNGRVRLHSANHVDITPWFPEIVEALAARPGRRTVLDAALCLLDSTGRNDAARLHERLLTRGGSAAGPAGLLVRDLLVDDGEDVRGQGWCGRRERLQAMQWPVGVLLDRQGVLGEGTWMHRQAMALGGRDVLAYRRSASYEGGRSRDCLLIPGASV